MTEPLRVVQVSPGLETGGAETMLLRLLERIDRRRFATPVLSLTGEGALGPRFAKLGVEVRTARAGSPPTPAALWRIRSELARLRPDVVQTWTIYGNVLGGLTARVATRAPIAWGVHHSIAGLESFGARVRATQRLERHLATVVPARIVACSLSSLEMMRELRYPVDRVETILNGFDTERLRPDPEARARARAELGLGEGDVAIGHVARLHPVKGHELLLHAAAEVVRAQPHARFVLCGTGVTADNPRLEPLLRPLGDRVLALGERGDMASVYPAFDLCCSSSLAEALPLAIGEAMACAVPVIATDTGDSADLVGDTGAIVPVGDGRALAAALAGLVEAPEAERQRLGEAARERIVERYSLDLMVSLYAALWEELASPRARASSRS